MTGNFIMEILGKVNKIIYSNDSFGIARAEIQDHQNLDENFREIFRSYKEGSKYIINIKGQIAFINIGINLKLQGNIVTHPKFGKQFDVTKYQTIADKNEIIFNAIEQKFIKGISKKSLEEIKITYPNIRDVLDNNSEDLLKIKGISNKSLAKIETSWAVYKENELFNELFLTYGISPRHKDQMIEIWKTPENAKEAIEENPYVLAEKIKGIGFKTADAIALNSGIKEDDVRRINACFTYIIKELIPAAGHSYYPYELLIHQCIELFKNKDKKISSDLYNKIIAEGEKLQDSKFIYMDRENNLVWNRELHFQEKNISWRLKNFIDQKRNNLSIEDLGKLDDIISKAEKEQGITLDPKQKEIVISAYINPIFIGTGGPGTGKTTLLKTYINVLEQYGIHPKDIALIAPTGKAAKRMTEAINNPNYQASTIHRLLGFDGNKFIHNEQEPFAQKFFIIDESSMIDIELFSNFLNAVPLDAKIFMLGDIDQLPSVGAGNILKDLLESEVVPMAKLEHIFRQKDNAFISKNAHAVKDGDKKGFIFGDEIEASDFFYTPLPSVKDLSEEEKQQVYKEDQQKIIEIVEKTLNETNPQTGKHYTLDDIMILLPMRKGELGVNAINKVLQETFNPKGKIIKTFGDRFRIGDKVIQNKNDYQLNVFNGEQGIIKSNNPEDESIVVDFYDKVVEIPYEQVPNMDLSYAMTVHKSQGSESPVTIICMTNSHHVMLQRNLLYTAITRTRTLCNLVGEKSAILSAIGRNKIQKRYTGLLSFLQEQPKQAAYKIDEESDSPSFN